MKTFWLSMHAAYACRHSGACCSSGWPIAVEQSRVTAIGMLRQDGSWLRPAPDAPAEIAGTIAVSDAGRCVFHRGDCEIQRAFGHAALPAACQHFPREVLIDPRGVFVTLSHYCPTAANLLVEHEGPVEIVEGPPAVPNGEAEGLDARDVLPPILTDGVLMDLDAYSMWERHVVRVLTRSDDLAPEEAVAELERDLVSLQRWRPGRGRLADEMGRLPAGPVRQGATGGDRSLGVVRRYLAARAFGSWMAYQAGGVSAVLRSLRLALAMLEDHHRRMPLVESLRQTDLELLHLMPRDELAAKCRTRR